MQLLQKKYTNYNIHFFTPKGGFFIPIWGGLGGFSPTGMVPNPPPRGGLSPFGGEISPLGAVFYFPPPLGGGSASGAVMGIPPSAGPRPAVGGWRGGGGGLLLCPLGVGGEKRKGEQRRRSSALARRAGEMAGGRGSSGCGPPSAPLAALWRFCWRWAPSAGPCSDTRFLPPPSPARSSRSWATGDGASGASWSPGSHGHCSQPCMPLAAETRSVCDSPHPKVAETTPCAVQTRALFWHGNLGGTSPAGP